MMKLLVPVFVWIILLASCQKETKELTIKDFKTDSTKTVITYGLVCGWCAGTDSLIISSNDLWYVSNIPCDNSTYVEHKIISDTELEDLLNSLNLNEFSKIDLNSCYTCVDGCDNWITVKTSDYYHHIRYADFDSAAISSIRSFIDKLDLFKGRFTEN